MDACFALFSNQCVLFMPMSPNRMCDAGIVMLMLDTKMDPPLAKSMICGAPDPLRSAFHLSYRMLLALQRSQMVSPEQVLRASFRQFQTERALPQLQVKKSIQKRRHIV